MNKEKTVLMTPERYNLMKIAGLIQDAQPSTVAGVFMDMPVVIVSSSHLRQGIDMLIVENKSEYVDAVLSEERRGVIKKRLDEWREMPEVNN